ncbi:MAG: Fur family transcriptional regulator [bacterium]
MTPQRALVFRLIEEMAERHPSAETLYVHAAREMPSMSLRTVYAVLDELATAGQIRPLDLGTGSKRMCTNPARHHHAVCIRCGKVEDIFVDVGPVDVPREQRRGFAISEYSVVFRGLCATCRA